MKQTIQVFVALAIFLIVELGMMMLWNLFVEESIRIETLFGKIFYISIIVLFVGGFLLMLVKMQIAQIKYNRRLKQKNDIIE